MIRSFLPVGQGAFYSETFACEGHPTFNMIYDCGSLKNVELVNQQIRRNYVQGEVIDAVFLSHLDGDHINGLPYLLRYCNVKNIFLPLLTQEVKEYLKIYNRIYSIDSLNFLVDFVSNPYQALESLHLSEFPQIYLVEPFETEIPRDDVDYRNAVHVSSGENVVFQLSRSTEHYNLIWQYIPFNFRQNFRLDELKNSLQQVFGNIPTAAELADMLEYEKNIKKIKKAYSSIHGSFNVNSMVLYSGPDLQGICDVFKCDLLGCEKSTERNTNIDAGCLYMGDYDASGVQKWEQLNHALADCWPKIGLIQIPHHGSSYNFNEKLICPKCQYIISAGTKNRFGHPHGAVLKSLLLNGKIPYIVTEQNASRRDFIIEM